MHTIKVPPNPGPAKLSGGSAYAKAGGVYPLAMFVDPPASPPHQSPATLPEFLMSLMTQQSPSALCAP